MLTETQQKQCVLFGLVVVFAVQIYVCIQLSNNTQAIAKLNKDAVMINEALYLFQPCANAANDGDFASPGCANGPTMVSIEEAIENKDSPTLGKYFIPVKDPSKCKMSPNDGSNRGKYPIDCSHQK